MVWDMGVWSHTMGWYGMWVSDIIPDGNGMVSITKRALSLYRQYASYIRYALTISGLAFHYSLISFERDNISPPGVPYRYRPMGPLGWVGYPISFRPLLHTPISTTEPINQQSSPGPPYTRVRRNVEKTPSTFPRDKHNEVR